MLPVHFGVRAEGEGHQPGELLEFAKLAYKAGFEFMPISDHFHPWFHTGAACPFAWSWISAAAASVPEMRFGSIVTAPMGRYHPALIAQAFATMDCMFPGRLFIALGTGEAMNELPLGLNWPKFDRKQILQKNDFAFTDSRSTARRYRFSIPYPRISSVVE